MPENAPQLPAAGKPHREGDEAEMPQITVYLKLFGAFGKFLERFGVSVSIIVFGGVCMWFCAPWIANHVILPWMEDRRAESKAHIEAIQAVTSQGEENTKNLASQATSSESTARSNWKLVETQIKLVDGQNKMLDGQKESHSYFEKMNTFLEKLADNSDKSVREQKKAAEVLENKLPDKK